MTYMGKSTYQVASDVLDERSAIVNIQTMHTKLEHTQKRDDFTMAHDRFNNVVVWIVSIDRLFARVFHVPVDQGDCVLFIDWSVIRHHANCVVRVLNGCSAHFAENIALGGV